MQNIKQVILFIIIIINSSALTSQDPDLFTSSTSGDWDDPSIWTNLGTDTDGIPDKDDTVVIDHSIKCTSTAHTKIATFRINNSGALAIDPVYKFQIWGANQSSSINGSGNIFGPGIINVLLTHTIEGLGTISNVSFHVNNWNLKLDVDATTNGITLVSGAGFKLFSGNTLTINGTVDKGSSSGILRNDGTFIINDANFMIINDPPSNGFRSDNGNIEYNVTGNFPVPNDGGYNDVTITGTATSNGDLTITGDFINTGTFTCSSGDNITFSGTSAQSLSGIGGVSSFQKLTLNNSNGLTFNDGDFSIQEVLETNAGDITNSSATITLLSNATGTAQLDDLGSNNYFGDLVVQRRVVTTTQAYRMFGSPVSGTNLSDWMDDGVIFSGFPNSNYPNFWGGVNAWYYTESDATNSNKEAGWAAPSDISDPTTPTLGTFIYTDIGTYDLSVTGTPYQGDKTIAVTNGDPTFSSDQRGWNLITNPYPCNVNWDSFHADNSSLVDDAYWIYNGTSGNLSIYADGFGSSDLSNVFAHSQGIWVHAITTSANITFKESHKDISSTTYIKSVNGINEPITVTISGNVNGYYDKSFLKTDPLGTSNYDQGLDFFKFDTPIPNEAPNVSFVSADGYKLNAATINNANSLSIPIDATVGHYAQGNYTLEFTNLSQFMIGACITLEDLHMGVTTDLRTDSVYSFISDSNAISPRFMLNIVVDYEINVENASCYGVLNGEIEVIGTSIAGSVFELIDPIGNTVDSIVAMNDSISFLSVPVGSYSLNTDHIGNCSFNNQAIIVTQPDQVVANFEMSNDTVYLDQSGEVTFTNLSSGGISYLWDFGDGGYSTDLNPTHEFLVQGVYPVILYADNENSGICTDVIVKNVIVLPTDPLELNEHLMLNSYNIYQNRNELIIEIKNNDLNYCYITDISGKQMMKKIKIPHNSNNLSIGIEGFSSGIYFIIIESKSGMVYPKKFFLN